MIREGEKRSLQRHRGKQRGEEVANEERATSGGTCRGAKVGRGGGRPRGLEGTGGAGLEREVSEARNPPPPRAE